MKNKELQNLISQQDNDKKIILQLNSNILILTEKSNEVDLIKRDITSLLEKNVQKLTNLENDLIHIRQHTHIAEEGLNFFK